MEKMPRARKSGLIVKEVDGEILIYDRERNKAHCLNPTAAKIWKHCDGETTLSDACEALARDLNTPVETSLVEYAVEQFSADHLLEADSAMPAFMIPGLNRRQMVRTLGLGALIAVPLVTSILAPTPAQAATCTPSGGACTTSATCCSGLCNTTTCA